MRLTEKKENGFYKLKEGQEIYGEENGIRLVQIVGQLEDIEEELGIDLITLFKAFRQDEIFIKLGEPYNGEKIKLCNSFCLGLFRHNYVLHCRYGIIYERNEFVYLKDYGKTWALTKEELE